jgi:multidrug efflux system outer membrane protein
MMPGGNEVSMKNRFLITILACAHLGVAAQEHGAGRVVLTPQLINELAEEARTNNAALWAARSRIRAAEENARSIPLWRDPEIMVGAMGAERMMRMEDGDLMYGVEQMLPVFGKEKAARNVALAEIPVEEADLEYQFQTLRKTIAEELFKAVLVDELLVLSQQDLAWLETLASAVEQRYAVGDATQVDVLRVQNERSRRAELIRNQENDREAAYAGVNRLLNRNVIAAWPQMELPELAPHIPFTTKLLDYAQRFEPQLRMMREQRVAAETMLELARKERRPEMSIAVESRQYARTGDSRSVEGILKMTVPLFNRGKYNAGVRREEARLQEIDYRIEDMIYQTRTEVHHLIAKIDNARREALLYENEIIPRSQQALRSAEAAWQASRDAFRDVLDARRMLLDARTMHARAVAEQYLALSELILCCGIGDLEALEVLTNRESDKKAHTEDAQ